jgi:hypothetical protein
VIGRRAILAGSVALAGMPTPGVALPSDLSFDVLRDGTRVGQHVIGFARAGDLVTATIRVEIVVRLGPIALFRYTHSAREIWRGDRFQELSSETNDDGKPFRVNMSRDGQQVIVEGSARPRAVVSPDTIPLTHWNVLCMRRPLVNPQDGLPIASRVVEHGTDNFQTSGGRTIGARRYSLVGTVTLDDWYDDTPLWTGLRTKARDGSMVEYRKV